MKQGDKVQIVINGLPRSTFIIPYTPESTLEEIKLIEVLAVTGCFERH